MAEACKLPLHYTWVACKPGWPGAYAAHTDDSRYRTFLRNWKRREKRLGASVQRVTCDEAKRMLDEYLNWNDEQPKRHISPRSEA